MPKLTIRSPAAAQARTSPPAVAAPVAAEPAAVPPADPNVFTDPRGRLIKLRTLSALEKMRLLQHLGNDNAAYWNLCMDLSRIAEIAGRPFDKPTKRIDLEQVMQILEDDGLAALQDHLAPPAPDARAGDSA